MYVLWCISFGGYTDLCDISIWKLYICYSFSVIMLYLLKSSWIWLKRCTHCRGFGVQSPSAYRFIRYVINEHYPYYAYEELKEHMNMLSKYQHKLGRLFFRLANFWQPDFCYCDQPQFLKYAQAGSHRMKSGAISEFLEKSAFHCVPNTDRILIWVDLEYAADVLDELLTKCTSQTLLVVNGINKKNHALWKKLQSDVHVGITYHLYYCGILFFDKSVYKQHYEVNF